MTNNAPPAWQAACLLRSARVATLATQKDGQPYAALVTHAVAHDGTALMLLSGLSEHTAHLRADPRCALLVAGPAPEMNPQTAPRLTFLAVAAPEVDPALKRRWLAIHPYAGFYAHLGDFMLWRLAPTRGQLVSGFASAHRLSAADLTPGFTAVALMADAEAGILAHCNDDHAGTLDAIARDHGGNRTGWRMVATDIAGCDLACGDRVLRIAWSSFVAHPAQVREELARLARIARSRDASAVAP